MEKLTEHIVISIENMECSVHKEKIKGYIIDGENIAVKSFCCEEFKILVEKKIISATFDFYGINPLSKM